MNNFSECCFASAVINFSSLPRAPLDAQHLLGFIKKSSSCAQTTRRPQPSHASRTRPSSGKSSNRTWSWRFSQKAGSALLAFAAMNAFLDGRSLLPIFALSNSRLLAERSRLSYRVGFRHTPRLDHACFHRCPVLCGNDPSARTRTLSLQLPRTDEKVTKPLRYSIRKRDRPLRLCSWKIYAYSSRVYGRQQTLGLPSHQTQSGTTIPTIPMSHANCDGNCGNDPTRPLRLSQGPA